jgi:hypothetical protein
MPHSVPPGIPHRRRERRQRGRESDDVGVQDLPQLGHILQPRAVGAGADPGVGDDEIRHAVAAHEVLRCGGHGRFVSDIHAVAARNQAERRAPGGVMPRQRLAESRGGAGDDDAHCAIFAACGPARRAC